MERAPETMLAFISLCSTIYQHSASTSVWCIVWHSANKLTSFVSRALPCNIGKRSLYNLLSCLMAVVIKAFGVFGCLEKHLKYLFGLFYDFWGVFITSFLRNDGCTLGYTYTIGVNYL